LAGAITLGPIMGDRRAGDIAAQVLKLLALIGGPAHRRMEGEAVESSAQTWRGWFVCARQACKLRENWFAERRIWRCPLSANAVSMP